MKLYLEDLISGTECLIDKDNTSGNNARNLPLLQQILRKDLYGTNLKQYKLWIMSYRFPYTVSLQRTWTQLVMQYATAEMLSQRLQSHIDYTQC